MKNLKHSELLIKSITPGEYEIFKQFSDKYYMYLLQNPHTLLTPIFGVFTLALSNDNGIPDIHFIVMKSVFDPNLVASHQKMAVFDLKGSKHGRKTLNQEDYDTVRDIRNCPSSLLKETLKDIDFENVFGSLNLQECHLLKTQMVHDADFLSKNNFMDYSLLMFMVFDFGEQMKDSEQLEDLKEEGEESKILESNLPIPDYKSSFDQDLSDQNGFEYKRYVYFGIIDYLTSFGHMKRFEEQFRQTYATNSSCVAPDKYGKRYVDFMENMI
jgi:hypothetical protein